VVLFDLDGSLTDPYPGISRCITYGLQRAGFAHADPGDHRAYIGPPLQETFLDLCGDVAAANAALAFYRERFSTEGLFENAVYPGIVALLESLSGRPLYVCTSKPAVYAQRIVEHFGLATYFARVYGSELDGTRTDKTELVAWLLRREGLRADDCVMVGDRSYDMRAAVANGVKAFGVLWGYGTEAELTGAGAEAVFATPDALAAALRSA
jgi:phosphoglycolate phosphatase